MVSGGFRLDFLLETARLARSTYYYQLKQLDGVDAFVDDHQNLVFVLYGQGYRAEGKEGILTTQVTVKAYDEDKKPINFSNLLDSLIVSEYQMEPNLWEVSHD
ncbi:Tn5253 hypothetical protein [Streptococcus pneumoniae]|nr:Tn5253 hypothetical protein [Streptococcus pneumoniae]